MKGSEGGRKVGSINEESQVRDCYNITFVYNQPGNCRLSPDSDTWVPRQQLKTTCFCRQEHWGKEDAAGPAWVECYFTSTETVGFLGTGAQDSHIDVTFTQLLSSDGGPAHAWTLPMIGSSNFRPIKKEEE